MKTAHRITVKIVLKRRNPLNRAGVSFYQRAYLPIGADSTSSGIHSFLVW